MVWNANKSSGLALAALVHGDRRLTRAAENLGQPTRSESLAVLNGLGGGDRRKELSALMAKVRPALTERSLDLPPRARALIAPRVARALGRLLVKDAPSTRLDFSPAASLVPALLRIARAMERKDAP